MFQIDHPIAYQTHTHTHTRLTTLFPGLPGWAGTRKVKPIWILLKQETVSGIGISWAICKSAPCSRQIATPAPHQSVFYRPDALPAAQPTVSKHWRPSHSKHRKNDFERLIDWFHMLAFIFVCLVRVGYHKLQRHSWRICFVYISLSCQNLALLHVLHII